MKKNPVLEYISDAKTLPEFLRRARVAQGYTLQQVEDLTAGQVSAQLYSLWERGRRFPTERKCVQIANALELDVEDLLWRVQLAKAPAAIKHRFPERLGTRVLPDEETLDGCYERFCQIVSGVPSHRRQELVSAFETLALQYQEDESYVERKQASKS